MVDTLTDLLPMSVKNSYKALLNIFLIRKFYIVTWTILIISFLVTQKDGPLKDHAKWFRNR